MTMSTFILRTVFIACIIVMAAPGLLCEECGSSVDDDKLYYYNDSVMTSLAESYCFMNECTIRIGESNVLLNVINNTGDWVIATNTTNLFIIFVNDSINKCSLDNASNLYQINTVLYIIEFIIIFAGIIAGCANVFMHLMFKELRTASGILIMILCISIFIVLVIDYVRTTIMYRQINTSAEICAVFSYLSVASINIYEATRTAILVHFGYTMYRSYRLLRHKENERSLLLRYIIFIIGASTVSSTVIIVADVLVHRKAFVTEDEHCIYFFDTPDREGIQLLESNVIYFVILLIWLLVEIILATIGLILYFLTTRMCCAASTSRDFRIFVIFIATIDLNAIIFVILLIVHVPVLIVNVTVTAANAIEQFALLVLFATSSKVMCCSTKGGTGQSNSNA